MSVEVNKAIPFDPTRIRQRRAEEGFVTSQKYFGLVEDIGDTRTFHVELLRQIGPAQKMVAIIRQTDKFDQLSGGGVDYSYKEEEWNDEDFKTAKTNMKLDSPRDIYFLS